MRSDRYVHPEFGLLSPTPRLRRELRMAFFSVLFGIGIGAATVIALSGNKTADDARVSGVSSDSVKSEQPTEAVLGYNRQREAEIDNEVMDRTSKSDGTKDQANSENRKTDATTTCEGNNLSCGNIPPRASRSRAMRIPAASGALAIGRAPLGRPDGSTGMTSASATSEAHPAEARSEGGAEARPEHDGRAEILTTGWLSGAVRDYMRPCISQYSRFGPAGFWAMGALCTAAFPVIWLLHQALVAFDSAGVNIHVPPGVRRARLN